MPARLNNLSTVTMQSTPGGAQSIVLRAGRGRRLATGASQPRGLARIGDFAGSPNSIYKLSHFEKYVNIYALRLSEKTN